jgi:hypothetical protein
MPKLTPEGEKIVAALAEQYKIGADAVKSMLDAVAKGGGGMAQFNVPELGGSGQWMRGGMTMTGDMFNNALKATVDNLCLELSKMVDNQTVFFAAPVQAQSQSQSQNQGGTQSAHVAWWPSELGYPAATGSQRSLRYAYFPALNRLVIESAGHVRVYDTTGHIIQGFSQQDGDSVPAFTSQRGTFSLDSLPRAYSAERAASEASAAGAAKPATGDAGAILSLIEQLAALRDKDILTDEEFTAKKAELLKRL